MYRDSIITLVIVISIHAFASPMNISICFNDDGWCPSELTLCANAYIMNASIDENTNNGENNKCNENCTKQSQSSLEKYSLKDLKSTCSGQSTCSLASVPVPTTKRNKGGTLTLTFFCNYTGPGAPNTVVIVVSIVVPIIIIVVVVVAVLYRRGQCKLLLSKCIRRCDKHSPDRADAYAMSSKANANLTYDMSRGVDENGYDIDYCTINKIDKEINVDYSHVMQAGQDTNFNHIGHFNSTSGDIESTYNHVGDEMLKNTNCSTFQPDTYSHIGAMANPASGQLADNSYAHINGVMKYIPTSNDVNLYDSAVFESNGGSTGGFRNQESDMKSGKEMEFNVVGPSKVESNNGGLVSHSYFILEKHAKEA